MRRLLVVLAASAFLFTSCADQPAPWRPDTHTPWPPPQPISVEERKYMPSDAVLPAPAQEVRWSEYRPGFKSDVDKAGDDHDCARLMTLRNEGLSAPTDEVLAITYINRWGVHLDCLEFAQEKTDTD